MQCYWTGSAALEVLEMALSSLNTVAYGEPVMVWLLASLLSCV